MNVMVETLKAFGNLLGSHQIAAELFVVAVWLSPLWFTIIGALVIRRWIKQERKEP